MDTNEEFLRSIIEGTTTKAEVKVSADLMNAVLILGIPKAGEKYTKDDILKLLNENNVSFGIDLDMIDKAIDEKLYGQEIDIAKGKASINGNNGEFKFEFDMDIKEKPTLLPDGSVDYLNTQYYQTVKAGDLIARYIPAGKGIDGITVTGKVIQGLKGKELPTIKGNGFKISEDKREYYASVDGKVEYKEGRLTVSNMLTINHDVDFVSGNIDFVGDVEIYGDVVTGMVIKANGDVIINGHVEGAIIVASGDVILKNGLQGNGKALIHAGGKVQGKFFESGKIIANGDLFSNSIMNCDIDVQGAIEVQGKYGAIIGGRVKSLKGIKATALGNMTEKITIVEAGIDKKLVLRCLDLNKLISKVNEEIALLEKSLAMFDQILKDKGISNSQDPRKTKILRAKILKSTELKEYLDEREILTHKIEEAETADIRVTGSANRGVSITINSFNYKVIEGVKGVRYLVRNGQVEQYSLV